MIAIENRWVKLIIGRQILDEVKVNRGIFQGLPLSPLIRYRNEKLDERSPEGIGIPDQKCMRTIKRKNNYNFLQILEAETMK